MGHMASAGPWCVIGKETWGVVQVIRVHEANAALYTGKHGWTVLIRDSEMPAPLAVGVDLRMLKSNPRRISDPPAGNGDEA